MPERSRTEHSFINLLTSMGGYALNVVLSFVCRIIFARLLGKEYLGISSMFSNVLSLLSLTELGIGTAMIYELYKPIAEKNEKKIASYMKAYKTAYIAVGVVVFLLGLAVMPFLNVIIKEKPDIRENIYLLYLLFLFSTASSYFFSYKSSLITANQRNYILVGINYAVVIVQDIFQIVALVLTKNYLLYLVLQVIFVFVNNVIISRKADRDYPYIKAKDVEPLSKDEKKSLLKNVKALTVTKLSGILVNNTDNLVITYFNGLIQTGIASNYSLLVTTLTSLVNQIFASLSASLGNLNAVGDEEHKYRVFKALNLANFWIYGWASIGIAVVSSDIVELCYGADYVLDFKIPLILAVNFYMLGMQCVVGLYKSTMGLFRYGQYALFLTAIINLIGDCLLGKYYGLFGIFLATAIARAVTNTWYEPFVVFKHGFKRKATGYALRYFLYLLILIFVGGICGFVCSLIRFDVLPRLILKLVVCIVVPNGLFFLFFFKLPEFAYLKAAVLRLVGRVIKRLSKRGKERE